jgi:SAM-dependent methyltransferase
MKTANHDQLEHWNDREATGDWVTNQERYDRMLEPFAGLILDAAALSPGEQVLDVGCGCGATTLAAARAVSPGTAAGIDLSAAMLARARENAAKADLSNASFEQADAQVHRFSASYDAVISRFGVMFFADPVAAFANLRAATRPGGRLAFACWQPLADNEWLLVPLTALAKHVPVPEPDGPDVPGMFSLSTTDRLRQVLSAAGWQHISAASERTPILIGGGTLDDAMGFLRGRAIVRSMLADVDQATRDRAMESVRDALAGHADGDEVRLDASVWLVTAQR